MKKYTVISIRDIDEVEKYLLMNRLEEAGSIGAEETENGVIVYFDQADWNIDIETILQDSNVTFGKKDMEEENWNVIWESNFEPVFVDDFVYVKAAFHPEQEGFDHIIHITPKMSFGTGHHATTFQVMQMMRKMEWKDKRVFDFGTGTGILAILAELLGASSILAIDNDAWSINNATENALNNQAQNITWQLSSIDEVPPQPFDIIIANINRHILLENMEAMKNLINESGQIIMSGILEEDMEIILNSAASQGFTLQEKTQMSKWLCLLFTKT